MIGCADNDINPESGFQVTRNGDQVELSCEATGEWFRLICAEGDWWGVRPYEECPKVTPQPGNSQPYIGACALYSMVDKSKQRFFDLDGEQKNKKKTFRSQIFFLFGQSFMTFLFLIRDNLSSLEDLSPIEYNANALADNALITSA